MKEKILLVALEEEALDEETMENKSLHIQNHQEHLDVSSSLSNIKVTLP